MRLAASGLPAFWGVTAAPYQSDTREPKGYALPSSEDTEASPSKKTTEDMIDAAQDLIDEHADVLSELLLCWCHRGCHGGCQ